MKKLTGILGIIMVPALLVLPMTAAAGQGFKTGKNMMEMQRDKGQKDAIGGKTSTLTTEQQTQVEKIQKKFREDNADTIKQLMTKRFDLNTILDSDKPDSDKAKAIQKEISDLQAKLEQKRMDMYFELLKINPDIKFWRCMGRSWE